MTWEILATKAKSLATYIGISAPLVGIFDMLGLNIDFMIIWAVLMVLDSILGWILAIMNSEFSSRTAQNRFVRKCWLIIALWATAFVGTQFPPIAYLSQALLCGFMMAELISILRHTYTIHSGKKLPESDVVKIILGNTISILTKVATESNKKK